MRERDIAAAVAIALLLAATSFAGEVRTYAFVGDLPAYEFSCGECSGMPYLIRAKVRGTFKVELDFEQGSGKLLSLEAKLTDAKGNFGPNIWRPVAWQGDFFQPYHWDPYPPPIDVSLEPTEYRPLGPNSVTVEYWAQYIGVRMSEIPPVIAYGLFHGVAYEAAPENAWALRFDGAIEKPGSIFTQIGAGYSVYFQGNEAVLSYYLPIIDATPSITAARATLIPEPMGLSMACLAVVCLLTGRRQHRPDGPL